MRDTSHLRSIPDLSRQIFKKYMRNKPESTQLITLLKIILLQNLVAVQFQLFFRKRVGQRFNFGTSSKIMCLLLLQD